MQRSPEELVIVVNEYGGTSGLVTIKDLIAEIIGDSRESAEAEDVALQMLDEQTFLVQAQLELESVNEILNFNLPIADEYQTLGGFLIHELQKIPAVGEIWLYGNLEFTVVSASGARLDQIRIRIVETSNPNNVSNTVW